MTLLWNNLADTATLAASSAVATLPVTFLTDPQLYQVWRTETTTTAYLSVDLGSSKSIDTVALLGTNLTSSATKRIRIDTSTPGGSNAYDSAEISAGIDNDYRHLIHFMSTPITGRYLRIDIGDATLTYLQAGRLVIGAAWRPEVMFRAEWEWGVVDQSVVTVVPGGHRWVDVRPKLRTVFVTYPSVTTTERQTHVIPFLRAAGMHKDALFMADRSSANPARDSLWGTLNREARMVAAAGKEERWALRLDILERV